MQNHLVHVANHTACRWWCLSWRELQYCLTWPLQIMDRSYMGRFAPDSCTTKWTQHFSSLISSERPLAESSGDPQDSEGSTDEKGSLQQWLLPRASTRIPMRPGSIISWSNIQTAISVFSPLLFFTCQRSFL